MSLIKWTTHSLTHLVKALSHQGHQIQRTALAKVLHAQGYSLKVNKKTMDGASHADRDQQFGHISTLCKQFEQKQAPAISVDCKKKELLGTVWVSIVMTPAVSAPRRPASKQQTRTSISVVLDQEHIL